MSPFELLRLCLPGKGGDAKVCFRSVKKSFVQNYGSLKISSAALFGHIREETFWQLNGDYSTNETRFANGYWSSMIAILYWRIASLKNCLLIPQIPGHIWTVFTRLWGEKTYTKLNVNDCMNFHFSKVRIAQFLINCNIAYEWNSRRLHAGKLL